MVIEVKSGKTRISAPAHPSATDGRVSGLVFSRVLRDSTPRFVGPSVGPSVRPSIGPSVTLYFFGVFMVFGLTAPAK